MYTFKANIDSNTHDMYVEQSPLCNLLQSSKWAKVKENWDCVRCGVYQEDTLVGCAQVLIKHLPLGFSMMYIPRGPVCDYDNKELVSFFMQSLKKWAKSYRCLYITYDPAIVVRSFHMNEKDKAYSEKANSYIQQLCSNSCIHKGYTLSIADTIQARFHMGVKNSESFLDHFPRATIRSINTGIRKGVEIDRYDINHIHEFANIMALTEERKNVSLRNEEYFKQLMEVYGDKAYLFLAKFNPKQRVEQLTSAISVCEVQLQGEELGKKARKKLEEELKTLKQELSSMDEILTHGEDEKVIAGGLMVGYGSEVEMLYAGLDDVYRSLRPQYAIYAKQFEYAFNQGYDYVNMGGVEGSLTDGLSVYKANFNPLVTEYIGEFDLVVSPLYKLANLVYNIRKRKNQKRS